MKKIRAIVKRPDEPVGHMTWISNSLQALQRQVDGSIQAVTVDAGLVVLCNEDGRNRGKAPNCTVVHYTGGAVSFVGDIVVVGASGDEFVDVPISLQEWKRVYLNK